MANSTCSASNTPSPERVSCASIPGSRPVSGTSAERVRVSAPSRYWTFRVNVVSRPLPSRLLAVISVMPGFSRSTLPALSTAATLSSLLLQVTSAFAPSGWILADSCSSVFSVSSAIKVSPTRLPSARIPTAVVLGRIQMVFSAGTSPLAGSAFTVTCTGAVTAFAVSSPSSETSA